MKCPVCPDSTLSMSNREGIEIDYCPTCRGVWLDRGELDKIIERAFLPANSPDRFPERRSPAPGNVRERERYDDDDDDDYRGRKKKRGGFLGELFDF